MSYALIADLGGTNARFALSPIGSTQVQEIKVLPCEEFDTLFLNTFPNPVFQLSLFLLSY